MNRVRTNRINEMSKNNENIRTESFASAKAISICEHKFLYEAENWDEEYRNILRDIEFEGNPSDYMGEPKYLGIDANLRASFYIGASWLKEHELAVVVTPKMPNIDFVKMFVAALEVDTRNESDYFAKCYGIHFDEPTIEADARLSQLTPMLVLHYVEVLHRLATRGLRRSYITREENLKAKVKGRIMLGRHLRQNVFQQRVDRVFCQYQEFTDDTPENRLLKRALLFAEQFIDGKSGLLHKIENTNIPKHLRQLKSKFEHISDDIEPYQIQHLSTNKLFRDYREAIRVAKMLLRRFDYSIAKAASEPQKTPPFWIDMARLYEMWVYGKLLKNSINEIEFQEDGFYGRQVADFVIPSESLILDAKYKLDYQKDNWVDINDIRELSGNARDEKLLPNLEETYSPRCIILYPGDSDELRHENEQLFENQGRKISHYRNFYKISVKLP